MCGNLKSVEIEMANAILKVRRYPVTFLDNNFLRFLELNINRSLYL